MQTYVVKYAVLNSNYIFNAISPVLLKIDIKRYNKEYNNFYSKLEKSILEEGVRNPIVVRAGGQSRQRHVQKRVPDGKILVCDTMGGSRLYICQKNNLEVPCFIADYGNYVDGIVLNEPTEMQQYCADKIARGTFQHWGIDLRNRK